MTSVGTRRLSQPLQIIPRVQTGTDRRNDPVFADGDPVSVLGALWQDSTRDENTTDSVARSDATALLPAGSVISTADAIVDTITGRRWQVDGEPDHQWNDRRSRVEHVVVKLRRGV